MNKLPICYVVVGFLLLTACSKPATHGTYTSSSSSQSYTGDWELLKVYCNDFLVQYSGFTESLTLDKKNQQATFVISESGCQTEVKFNITQQNNTLTLASHNMQCRPQSCSITPIFIILGQEIEKSYSCPDLPPEITVEATLSDDRDRLTVNVPLFSSKWTQCELIYIKTL